MQYDSNSISWAAELLASTSYSFPNGVCKFSNDVGIDPAKNNLSKAEVHILQNTQKLPGKWSFKGEWSAGAEKGKGPL